MSGSSARCIGNSKKPSIPLLHIENFLSLGVFWVSTAYDHGHNCQLLPYSYLKLREEMVRRSGACS